MGFIENTLTTVIQIKNANWIYRKHINNGARVVCKEKHIFIKVDKNNICLPPLENVYR